MLREICFKNTEHTPEICTRAAARGVIGSANFALIVMAQQDVRARNQVTEAGADIDGYNAIFANEEEEAALLHMQREQGGEVRMSNRERGGYLRCIIDALNADLTEYAARVRVEHKGKTIVIPEPFHVGDPLSRTLSRQIERQPQPSDAAMKARAAALGVTEQEMIESQRRAQQTQAMFLMSNKMAILEMAMSYTFANPESLDIDNVFDKLPYIDQLRLLIAADNGLYFARSRDANSYVLNSKREDLLSNVGAYDNERKLVHIRINDFCKEPHVKKELKAAHERGETIPVLRALITPIKPEEKKAA